MDDLVSNINMALNGQVSSPQSSTPDQPAQAQVQQQSSAKLPPFDPNKSYGTPSNILDGLTQTENSGKQYGINKQTKAMGPYQFTPETLQSLHQQGVKFDPFDPVQARNAADYYLQSIAAKNGGDMDKALGSYGGFITKDPSGYIASVKSKGNAQSGSGGGGGQQIQQPTPAYGGFNADALINGLNSGADDGIHTADSGSNNQPNKVAQPTPSRAASFGYRTGVGEAIVNAGTGLAGSMFGGFHGLGKMATTAISDLASGKGVQESLQSGALAGANAVKADQQAMTYQPRTDAGKMDVQILGSKYNPLNAFTTLGNYLGGKTLDATGSPLAGAAVNTAVNAAPMLLGKLFGGIGTATEEGSVPNPGEQGSVPNPGTADQATAPESRAFDESYAPGDKPLPLPEQQARAQILQRVGFDPNAPIRMSALTGDGGAAATDAQQAKLDTPVGSAIKAQLANERDVLQNHAENIVKNTGGTLGTDQASMYSRGNVILDPLNALKGWYDSKISQLYGEADARAQGTPTQLNEFKDVLNDESLGTNSDRINLRSAANSYAKKIGLVGEGGQMTGSVQQAETMRKYLNENWSPQNSGFVGKLKDALDNDVTSAAGEDIYSQARALRADRAKTLDDPNGIAKIMDSDSSGINRKVDIEKVPQSVTGLGVDQLGHVIDTLKNVPDEIQPQAQAALAEIKAQMANQILDTGNKFSSQWNARGVTQGLKQNSAKLNVLFGDDQNAMQSFSDLNDAGHILSIDKSYPGAAVQTFNLAQRGAVGAIRPAAAAIGSVAGPAGTFLGDMAGSVLAKKIADKAEFNAIAKRSVKLSDFVTKP